MEKIVYDSLYKFLVSVGIVICVAPILFGLLFFNIEPTIISQEEYELLSEYSKNTLDIRERIVISATNHIIVIIIICFLIGIAPIVIGLVNWTKVQKELDTELKLKNTKQMKELTDSEKIEKILTEVKEDSTDTQESEKTHGTDSVKCDANPETTRTIINGTSMRAMIDYAKVEDFAFAELSRKLKRKYLVKKGIRAGRSEIDIVAQSRKDNIDILYEVKYYNRPYFSEKRADFIIAHMRRIAIDYEKEYSRNTKLYLLVYIPERYIDDFENRVRETLNGKSIEFPFEIEFHTSDNIIDNQKELG